MPVIRDKDGNIIQRSKNLRGIRMYVRKNIIKILSIDKLNPLPDGDVADGKLMILFENGCSFETEFASYKTLVNFVRNWRAAYGHRSESTGTLVGMSDSTTIS